MIKKLHLFLLLLCSLIGLGGYAQTFPIRITTQLTQPSPIYLSNYADANTINSPIKIQLVLNDLTISNRQVRLKIYFQGNGIAFNTNDFVVGAKPLYLEGGFPLQLTNVDLAPYFEYQNLLGLTPNQYAQPLPEGVYNIYVEVYDFATNRKLSTKTGSTTIIFQNDPPFLNLPLNNASIMQQNIQNIVFGWTPRSINVSNVEYEFSLVEIWDKYTPVQNAFAYSPPLYTTTTRTTSLQYGMNQPQLIPGKKYAWRVKAKALLGAEEIGVFKNNGYSEIFSFDYEVFCTAPLAINTEGISENQAKITWTGSIDNFDYQVKYREKNSGSEWYDVVTPRETSTISNLKPNTTYEYSVGSSCDVGKYTHSTIKEFTTLVRDEIAFQGCGIKPDPNDLANKNPLPSLFPNDVIAAGDFPIVVIHATGSNGNFSGDGYVTLPFLEKFRKLIDAADALGGDKINIGQFSRIRITFNNIGLNTDFKLISGEIIAAYDPNWSSMVDGDKVLTDVLGSDGKPVQGKVDFEVKSTTLNPDGSTTIIGTDGQSAVIPKSSYDQVYTDSKGNTVTIPANGKGEPSLSSPAEGGKAVAANTNGMSSSGEVTQISSSDVTITFSDSSNSKYAFDPQPANGSKKLLDSYETLTTKSGGTYKVNYKAVSDLDGSDKIIAKADFKNGKTNKDIVFKTNTGAAVEATWTSASQAEITLTKKLDFAKQSIVATVKGSTQKNPADSTKTIEGKSDIAGKINVWELTKKPSISITLLSINKASAPSADEAKKFLNAVYNKVGITFDVTSQSLSVGTLPNEVECGDSDLLNVYTGGQNNIIGQIESNPDFKYNEKTYYILYTGKTGQNGYKGFMPLGGQYAFVFDNTLKTAAHELGHGIFGLKHPFSTAAESGKTDLLMDYGTGTVLSHNDWDIIHSGGWKFYGFQKSSSGASSLIVSKFLKDEQYLNKTVFKFVGESNSVFYYKGYKITFNQKNVRLDVANDQFTIIEDKLEKKLQILFIQNPSADEVPLVLCYLDKLSNISKDKEGNYSYKELTERKVIFTDFLPELYKNELPAADLAQLNDKIKDLGAEKISKIQDLLKSLPLNEIAEICGKTGKCYDIFNKQYTAAEWDEIIKFLENKKNQSIIDLERLPVSEQLLAIKALLASEKNIDKISRLNLNAVDRTSAFEYPDYFKIEYLGNTSGTNYIRIELLNKFKIEKVERKFLLSYTANSDLVNNDKLEFLITLETAPSQTLTTLINKGTSVQVKTANAITNTVIVVLGAFGAAELVAGVTLSEEQIAACVKSMAQDAAIQAIADVLVRNFSDNEEGLPMSYTSLAVSCAMGTMTDIKKLDACMAGAIIPIGDAIIHNLTKKTPPKTITEVTIQAMIGCFVATTLHMAFTNPTVQAKVRQAIKWVLIKNAIKNAKIPYTQRQAIVNFLIKGEKFFNKTDDFISADLFAEILNNTSDDIAVILQKLDNLMISGNRVIKQGEEIVVVDASNQIISKFKNGFWYSVENAVIKETTQEIADKFALKLYKGAVSNMKSTPNATGASITSTNDAYTIINQFNSQGNVSATADALNFNALIDGNNALEAEVVTYLRVVKEVDEEILLLPKANTETGLIVKADNIPVINLVPYNVSYYKGISGKIELILATGNQTKNQAQVIFATANVLTKLKEEQEKEKDKCKVYTKFGDLVCKKFNTLLKETNEKAGIDSLYKYLNKNVNEVLDKLIVTTSNKVFINDITVSKGNLSQYIQNYTSNIIDNWSLLKTNKKDYARKDWNTIVQIGKLNEQAKTEIIKFSDGGYDESNSTLKEFTAALEKVPGFTDFVNKHIDYAKGFLGHKQDPIYTPEQYEFLTPETVEEVPLSLELQNVINDWLKYSKEDAKRQNYFKLGKDFEKAIEDALKSDNSAVYKDLLKLIPDLGERQILSQVQFCIDKDNPCTNEGEYFIADFVFIKRIKGAFSNTWDVIIADTKLSENTSFTNNQKEAMKKKSYFLKSIKRPALDLKNNEIEISIGDKVFRNVLQDSFIKIYSTGKGIYKNSKISEK